MRTFILYLNKARTDEKFNIDDLPSSGGRMDVLCRAVTSSLWLSHSLREETKLIGVLNGPPNPPVSVYFNSNTMKFVSPDERSISFWIKKALAQIGKTTRSGIYAERKSFQEIIKELKDMPIYILHESGKNIFEVKILDNPVFILGDHIGIPKKDENFAMRYAKEKISLGKKSYLASSCISIINWILDVNLK
ncbi:MAG: tRNA (pseudouridine(54)-N(1))-methyltransferase TrmY [Candidatus Aenigmarchaeota archaeon]|nr:tRNA (pseudouridine(54)-N(1))-methyltransferase TrmY [Candidatus Aenigmarchaeota archaeon]